MMAKNTLGISFQRRLAGGVTLLVIGAFAGLTLSSSADDMAKTSEKAETSTTSTKQEAKNMGEIYNFEAKALDGKDIKFDQYKGDVLLIVNVASKCGFTPQYAGLEALNKKYAEKGLKILGFPCNQFGSQEPGDAEQIGAFCTKNYGVDFQMFEKIDVNGKDAHPLYKYLENVAPGMLGTKDIKWNFTKFLVDRKGNVIKRYASTVKPEELTADIEKELSGS